MEDYTFKQKYIEYMSNIWPEIKINIDEIYRNNITGALLDNNNFEYFRNSMQKRFQRLHNYFPNEPHILNTIKNLHSEKNWQGSLCELIAYDLLSSTGHVVMLQKQLDIDKTLAKHINKKGATEIDAYMDIYKSNFEIKSLKDNIKEIIDNLTHDFRQCVTCEYDYDIEYSLLQNKFGDLKKELTTNINRHLEDFSYRSTICDKLLFHVYNSRPKVTTSIHCYCPYTEAETLERLPLAKYHQLSIELPNIKIFVTHPWINGNCYNGLFGPEILFRSLARRVFCKLAKIQKPYDSRSKVTCETIAKTITGLMFIVDNSVAPSKNKYNLNDNDFSVFDVYIFWNPNVYKKNKIIGFNQFEEDLGLRGLNVIRLIDDFQSDNY